MNMQFDRMNLVGKWQLKVTHQDGPMQGRTETTSISSSVPISTQSMWDIMVPLRRRNSSSSVNITNWHVADIRVMQPHVRIGIIRHSVTD